MTTRWPSCAGSLLLPGVSTPHTIGTTGAGHSSRTPSASPSGERTGVAVHLTHAHLGYDVNQGRAGELLSMVDDRRAAAVST